MFNKRPKLPAIAGILALAALLRCLVILAWFLLNGNTEALHYPDTATYLAPAQSLLDHGTLERNGSPEIIRGPGYPLLLTLGLAAGHVEAVTVLLQMLLSVATVYLVYRCALELANGQTRLALAAAALYAVEPLSVVYSCLLLTETLFTFLIASFLFALIHFLKHDSARSLLIAAVLLSASAFVRPVSYYLPLVVTGVLLFVAPRNRGFRRPLGLATGFLLACAIPLGAWQVRNWQLASYPGFSAIVENGLYFYQQAAVTASLEGRSLDDVQAELGILDPQRVVTQHPEWQGLSEGEIHVRMGAEGKRVIRQHPLTYAKNHLRSIFGLLITPGSGDIVKLTGNFGHDVSSAGDPSAAGQAANLHASSSGSVARVAAGGPARIMTALLLSGIAAAYLLLAALGSFGQIPARLRWTLIAIGVYFWIVSCLPQPPARLRHPLMPILCLLAAYGVFALIARIRQRASSRRLAEPLASPVSLTGFPRRPRRAVDAAVPQA
jgi:4-amino-4-deoxy-L-arabinose transferase-like glycosyltransferase